MRVIFHTNVDCAQRLLNKINEDNWFKPYSAVAMPLVGDRIRVFSEKRGTERREANMKVCSRTWVNGDLMVELHLDDLWHKKVEYELNDKLPAIVLFEHWITWR